MPRPLYTRRKKARRQLYRRLVGPQGRFRWVWKISPPPGFGPRTVQPVGRRCTDWAIDPQDAGSIAFRKQLCRCALKRKAHWLRCLVLGTPWYCHLNIVFDAFTSPAKRKYPSPTWSPTSHLPVYRSSVSCGLFSVPISFVSSAYVAFNLINTSILI